MLKIQKKGSTIRNPRKTNKRIEVLLNGDLGASRRALIISFHVKEMFNSLTAKIKLKIHETVTKIESRYKIIPPQIFKFL